MKSLDENLERLIVRQLDGELSMEEELELNRELVRNPEARQLMEEYAGVDELASEVLKASFSHEAAMVDVDSGVANHERSATWRGRAHRGWLMIPGAIAAAILAIVFQPAETTFPGNTSTPVVQKSPVESMPSQVPSMRHPDNGMMRMVDWSKPRIKRNAGRDVIGVIGDDGNIYFLEVDRTQTVRQPRRISPRNQVRQEL